MRHRSDPCFPCGQIRGDGDTGRSRSRQRTAISDTSPSRREGVSVRATAHCRPRQQRSGRRRRDSSGAGGRTRPKPTLSPKHRSCSRAAWTAFTTPFSPSGRPRRDGHRNRCQVRGRSCFSVARPTSVSLGMACLVKTGENSGAHGCQSIAISVGVPPRRDARPIQRRVASMICAPVRKYKFVGKSGVTIKSVSDVCVWKLRVLLAATGLASWLGCKRIGSDIATSVSFIILFCQI